MKKFIIQNSIFNILFFVLLFSAQPHAQSLTSSPYSRYGLGELITPSFVQSFSIGGLGIALQNDSTTPFNINVSNPASYVSTRITTYEAGFYSSLVKQESKDASQLNSNNSLGYLSFCLPISNYWASSFGLIPYSSVGYKISNQEYVDSIGKVNNLFQGSGGINRFYFGNSFRLKNFFIGINASYLFGTIQQVGKLEFPANNYFNILRNHSTNIGDFYFDYGAQYLQRINNDWSIVLGATAALSTKINAKSTVLSQTYVPGIYYDIIKDTVQNISTNGNVTLPLAIGGGLMIKKGQNLMIGAEYAVQDWSNYTYFGLKGEELKLKNNVKMAIGAQFVPDRAATIKGSYWSRVFYRAGFRYSDNYLNLKNTPSNEYALSFGFGLPVGRNRQMQQCNIVNLGIELGERGTINNGLIKEQFVKLLLGLSLNDRWFIKSKID